MTLTKSSFGISSTGGPGAGSANLLMADYGAGGPSVCQANAIAGTVGAFIMPPPEKGGLPPCTTPTPRGMAVAVQGGFVRCDGNTWVDLVHWTRAMPGYPFATAAVFASQHTPMALTAPDDLAQARLLATAALEIQGDAASPSTGYAWPWASGIALGDASNTYWGPDPAATGPFGPGDMNWQAGIAPPQTNLANPVTGLTVTHYKDNQNAAPQAFYQGLLAETPAAFGPDEWLLNGNSFGTGMATASVVPPGWNGKAWIPPPSMRVGRLWAYDGTRWVFPWCTGTDGNKWQIDDEGYTPPGPISQPTNAAFPIWIPPHAFLMARTLFGGHVPPTTFSGMRYPPTMTQPVGPSYGAPMDEGYGTRRLVTVADILYAANDSDEMNIGSGTPQIAPSSPQRKVPAAGRGVLEPWNPGAATRTTAWAAGDYCTIVLLENGWYVGGKPQLVRIRWDGTRWVHVPGAPAGADLRWHDYL